MADNVVIEDFFKTNATIDQWQAVGSDTQKGDGVLIIGIKAAETDNTGNVFIRKASGNGVTRKIEPGEEITFGGPNGKEFAMNDLEYMVKTANDGIGVILSKYAPFG